MVVSLVVVARVDPLPGGSFFVIIMGLAHLVVGRRARRRRFVIRVLPAVMCSQVIYDRESDSDCDSWQGSQNWGYQRQQQGNAWCLDKKATQACQCSVIIIALTPTDFLPEQ